MSWPTASCGAEGEQQLVDAVAPGMEMGALSCGDLPDPMWLMESAFTIENSVEFRARFVAKIKFLDGYIFDKFQLCKQMTHCCP